MATIFTKIVQGEVPAYKIAEDDHYLAFLDAFPLKKGHVLVIPKKEVDYIFDLEDDLYIGLQLFAKRVAKAMKKVLPCTRIGITVIGLEVPHTHIHLLPIDNIADMNFAQPKLQLEKEEMEEVAASIAAAFL